jgi:hypothetical protein
MTIEQYFQHTNRKFYQLIFIQRNFPDWKNELNELASQNKIAKRNGLNTLIIEVL